MNEEEIDPLEKALNESNKDNVTLISDGLTKQYFIELDQFTVLKGKLYQKHLLEDEWSKEPNDENQNAESKEAAPSKTNQIFSTEINEKSLADALKRRSIFSLAHSVLEKDEGLSKHSETTDESWNDFSNYLVEDSERIKERLNERANIFYQMALKEFRDKSFSKSVQTLKKAISINSIHISFYLLKYESFIQLCDFNSALLTINKILSVMKLWPNKSDLDYNELKSKLNEKVIFCHYMMGQSYFDLKQYLDALNSFNKASELQPSNLLFKIKSVSCLHVMNRMNDSIGLINKIINESFANKNNSDLYLLRARLNLKENNILDCFYDLETALKLNESHKEANILMEKLKSTADNLRNTGLVLSLNNRVADALNKLNVAITFNPRNPEYYLQRGILYKRLKDFNSAIDDFLMGVEKHQQAQNNNQVLFQNFQRQILLTYNDFALQCIQKGFYDDAIILLNKAIKSEKNEKGLYMNRGDCFNKKNEKKFALLDYGY